MLRQAFPVQLKQHDVQWILQQLGRDLFKDEYRKEYTNSVTHSATKPPRARNQSTNPRVDHHAPAYTSGTITGQVACLNGAAMMPTYPLPQALRTQVTPEMHGMNHPLASMEPLQSPNSTHDQLSGGFRPSRAAQDLNRAWTLETTQLAMQAGAAYNPNFKSDLSKTWLRNQDCPMHLNCAIRIENISADANDKAILELVREGKIFQFFKVKPVPGRFRNCAARLVFTTRASAEAFIIRGEAQVSHFEATNGSSSGTRTSVIQPRLGNSISRG